MEDKRKKMQDRQEKYAQENYSGVEDIGKGLLSKLYELKKMWIKFKKSKASKSANENALAYANIIEYGSSMNIEFIALSLKLSNVVGYALNASSTKMIKKVIEFLDTYSLNDTLINSGLIRVASGRQTDGNILDMALAVAAKTDDIEFTKYIYKFMKKNEDRENIYDDTKGVPNEFRRYGEMNQLSSLKKKQDIAFEALINNSSKMYNFITEGKGLKKEFIMKYISDKYYKKLSKAEVENVLNIETDLVNDIIEHMPENLPENVQDIFMF